ASALKIITEQLSPTLGAYWQQTLTFLDIALTVWPQILATLGMADPAFLRGARLDRQADAAPLIYGDRPVIAAGSTGSIPATARLLGAIHRLPRGAIVLPGFDTDLTPQNHADLLDDGKNPHGHPQYGLARLLRALGAGVGDVVELGETGNDRTTMVRRALALTDDTAHWVEQRLDEAALARASTGLSIIQARNEDEEARAIALAARQALADRQSVGIVTPDRNLARRIAAELKRYEVEVDDAAGTPLFQSTAGRLLRQILVLVESQCAAVDLIALLRNRAALFGLSHAEIGQLTDDIELGLLRGQRPGRGLAGMRALLKANVEGVTTHPARRLEAEAGLAIEAFFDRIEAAIAPLVALAQESTVSASRFAGALMAAFAAVANGAELPGRRELDQWGEQLAGHENEGHLFPPRQLDGVLAALMLGAQVRSQQERRSDIAIWGTLEARLMNPDLLILAGLNEDVWPEVADPGPWLSRGMRLGAGLEPPERRQGQAAHDFVQGLGNGEVIIAYAERVGTSPAQPSRLLQRLEAFAGASGLWYDRGAPWLEQARRLDAVSEVKPAGRPAPNPPVEERPRKLSVTAIETLMRSPYDIYAANVLKLKPLDPLGETAEARERGNTVHEILSRFVIEGHQVRAPDALERMMQIAEEEFGRLHVSAELRAIWLRRFETAARQFLDYESEREPL